MLALTTPASPSLSQATLLVYLAQVHQSILVWRNTVTNFDWHYTGGRGKVKFGTNGRVTPALVPLPTPGRVSGPYAFFGVSKTGNGIPALIGTVTIRVDTGGTFQGGAIQYPDVDGFLGSAGSGVLAVTGGSSRSVVSPNPVPHFSWHSALAVLA